MKTKTCFLCNNQLNSRHRAKQIFHIKTDCRKKGKTWRCVYQCADCGGEKAYNYSQKERLEEKKRQKKVGVK